MKQPFSLGCILLLAISSFVNAQAPTATAQAPPTASQSQPQAMISSHQIDRYEAIRQLQSELRSQSNNKEDWMILGELAHEVAYELPRDQDTSYYRISREAYERALQLDSNNAGLKAAVQFAMDQEAGAARFDEAKRRGVASYLSARRRELSTAGAGPTLRVYSSPTPTKGGTKPAISYPSYATYAPPRGQPYTYQRYSSSSLPSVSSTAANATPRLGQSNPASTGGAVKPAAASAPP